MLRLAMWCQAGLVETVFMFSLVQLDIRCNFCNQKKTSNIIIRHSLDPSIIENRISHKHTNEARGGTHTWLYSYDFSINK